MRLRFAAATAALIALGMAPSAQATTVPFTEDFLSDVASWEDSVGDPLTFVASGGPDGSSYASTSFNYFGFSSPFGGGPVIFRANDSDDASGDAFVGDWTADGVAAISAFVRHDTGEDLTFFMRYANSFNFPGAVVNSEQIVESGVWTEVTWLIDPDSPLCVGETVTCADALLNVGNFQIGTSAPLALTELDQAFTIDVDQVSIVPEPGTLLLFGFGVTGLAAFGRRRDA